MTCSGPFAYPKRVKAIIPTPSHPYYLWQVVVQARHLAQKGVTPIYVVYGQEPTPPPLLRSLMGSLPATFHYYRDMRSNEEKAIGYHASMKPALMARLMEDCPLSEGERYLYLDPDVVLAGKTTDWPEGIAASDTDSYTGPRYLDSKGALGVLCNITGASYSDALILHGYGAQYLLADIPARVWHDIYRTSVEAYKEMTEHASRYHPAGDQYAVQAWCAEMYTTQLVFLREGIIPTTKGMSFLWANGPVSEWDHYRFFHDAGVTDNESGHFGKLAYQVSPFGKSLDHVKPSSASSKYIEMIKEAENAYPELVKEFSTYE